LLLRFLVMGGGQSELLPINVGGNSCDCSARSFRVGHPHVTRRSPISVPPSVVADTQSVGCLAQTQQLGCRYP
jgi:hypothetical protein